MRRRAKSPTAPLSPACKAGDHHECAEHLWHKEEGRWLPCPCLCHMVVKEPGEVAGAAATCSCPPCVAYRRLAEEIRRRIPTEEEGPPEPPEPPDLPEPPEDPLEPPW